MAQLPSKQSTKAEAQPPTNGGSGAQRVILRPLTSPLVERGHFANQTGMSFVDPLTGGFRRDVYSALGYPKTITLRQYFGRYERGGVAKRIIEAYPNATWGGGGEIVENPDPRVTTSFEKEVAALFGRLDIWNRFRRADTLAGLGHYSVILIGSEGELKEPLSENLSGEEAILYLTPRGEEKAQIPKFDDDPQSERFGLPETYQVTLGKNSQPDVHWSRIIHIVEGNLENEVFGNPRLKAIWNYLEDLDKNVGGGSEAAWKRMDPGMHLDIPLLDPNGVPLEIPESVMTDIEDEVEEFQHGMRRFVRTRGVNLDQFKSDATMFGANVDTILKLISATTGIPIRILTGSERGRLASIQDDDNWNDRVTERRSGFAAPLVTDFVDEMIERGALPRPGEDGYKVVWPEADELDEKQKAEVAGELSKANQNQSASGDGIIITRDEIRDQLFDLEPLDTVAPEFTDQELGATTPQEIDESIVGAAEFTNEDAEEPEWKAVHRASDANNKQFATSVLDFWALAGDRVDEDELQLELQNENVEAATELVVESIAGLSEEFMGDLVTGLHKVLVDGANNAAAVANRRDGWTAAQFNITFDATSPESIAWAEQNAAILVTETLPETVAGIRQLIVDGLAADRSRAEMTRAVRSFVGLRSDQVTSVANLATELRTADPGTLVTRFDPAPGVRKQAGFKVRIPAEGLAENDLQRRLAQYSNMQLNLRARTIARTETMNAANAGQRQLWQQAQTGGQLANDAQRVWITTPDERLRPDHAEREGETVGVNEDWPWGTEPGEEVNCRCAQGIA